MAAKKASRRIPSKSQFIRSQPVTMTAREIIAAGRRAGIKLTGNYIYRIRTLMNASTHAKPDTPRKGRRGVEAVHAFVRSRPHLSPGEIVEDAEAAGLKLDTGYVHSVRGKPERGSIRPSQAKAEGLLRALGAELGLRRAIEILEAERARVRAVIGAE